MDKITQYILEQEKMKGVVKELFVQAGELQNMSKGKQLDIKMLRLAIIAELDAVNFYDQLSEMASNSQVSKLFLDISREEKVHAGEFETLMERIDPDYEKAEKEGEKEVDDLLGI
jgi:rubrerythrin